MPVLVGRDVDAHARDGRGAEPAGIVLRGLGGDEGSKGLVVSMNIRAKNGVVSGVR